MPLRERNPIAIPVADEHGPHPYGFAVQRLLPIHYVSQHPYQYLCWAACGQMAFSNFGKAVPLCQLASWNSGDDCCVGGPMPGPCDERCWPHLAYDHFEMHYDALDGVMDDASIRDELFVHHRPVQMLLDYSGAFHTALIVGTSAAGDFLVMDPLIAERVECDLEMLFHAYGTGGFWRATYWQLEA